MRALQQQPAQPQPPAQPQQPAQPQPPAQPQQPAQPAQAQPQQPAQALPADPTDFTRDQQNINRRFPTMRQQRRINRQTFLKVVDKYPILWEKLNFREAAWIDRRDRTWLQVSADLGGEPLWNKRECERFLRDTRRLNPHHPIIRRNGRRADANDARRRALETYRRNSINSAEAQVDFF